MTTGLRVRLIVGAVLGFLALGLATAQAPGWAYLELEDPNTGEVSGGAFLAPTPAPADRPDIGLYVFCDPDGGPLVLVYAGEELGDPNDRRSIMGTYRWGDSSAQEATFFMSEDGMGVSVGVDRATRFVPNLVAGTDLTVDVQTEDGPTVSFAFDVPSDSAVLERLACVD